MTMQNNNPPITLRVCYVRPNAAALYCDGLQYATHHAAGIDLRACLDPENITIAPQERVLIPSGIAVEPYDMHTQNTAAHVAGFVYSRSGLGAKQGVSVAQGVGVIDSDYRGEIMIMLLNTSLKTYCITRGERIAQLIYAPIVRPHIHIVQTLNPSERGTGGFGHTGKL